MSNQIRNTTIHMQGKSLAFRKDVGTAYAQRGFYEFNNINAFDITDDGAYFTIKPITK